MSCDVVCYERTDEKSIRYYKEFLQYQIDKYGLRYGAGGMKSYHSDAKSENALYVRFGILSDTFNPYYDDTRLFELLDNLGLSKNGENFVVSGNQFDDGIAYINNTSFTVFDVADFLNRYAKIMGFDYKVKIHSVDSEKYGLRFCSADNSDTDELALKDMSVALENLGLSSSLYTDDDGHNMRVVSREDISKVFQYGKDISKEDMNKLLLITAALNNHFTVSGAGLKAKISGLDDYEIFFFDKDGTRAERLNKPFHALMHEFNDLNLDALLTKRSCLQVSSKYDMDDIYSYLYSKEPYAKGNESRGIFDLLSVLNKQIENSDYRLGVYSSHSDGYLLSFYSKNNGQAVNNMDFDTLGIALPYYGFMKMPRQAIKEACAYFEGKAQGEDLSGNIFGYLDVVNSQMKNYGPYTLAVSGADDKSYKLSLYKIEDGKRSKMLNTVVLGSVLKNFGLDMLLTDGRCIYMPKEVVADACSYAQQKDSDDNNNLFKFLEFLNGKAKHTNCDIKLVYADENSYRLACYQDGTGERVDFKGLNIYGIDVPSDDKGFIIPKNEIGNIVDYAKCRNAEGERIGNKNVFDLFDLLKQRADLYKWELCEGVGGKYAIRVTKTVPEELDLAKEGMELSLSSLSFFGFDERKDAKSKIDGCRTRSIRLSLSSQKVEAACAKISNGFFEEDSYYSSMKLVKALNEIGMGKWYISRTYRDNYTPCFCLRPDAANKGLSGRIGDLKLKNALKRLGLRVKKDNKDRILIPVTDNVSVKTACDMLNNGVHKQQRKPVLIREKSREV